MTKTTCDRCGKQVDPITCGFRIEPLKIGVPIMAIDLCDDCQNKVKSFIFDQDKPAADKQTNLEWFREKVQTMSADEIVSFIYSTYGYCSEGNSCDTNESCQECFRAWLEEEHNEL